MRETLEQAAGSFPPALKISPIADQSIFVRASIRGVVREALIAAALTGLMILLFLGSLRSALIVGITIPFAMMVAFSLMHLTNIPANLLSLGAIDFGIIVDASIVMT